jgi:hypothetical protein
MQPLSIQLSLSQAKADPSIAWARFSPLLPLVQLLDVVLFVIIRFLHQVSLIVQSVEN